MKQCAKDKLRERAKKVLSAKPRKEEEDSRPKDELIHDLQVRSDRA